MGINHQGLYPSLVRVFSTCPGSRIFSFGFSLVSRSSLAEAKMNRPQSSLESPSTRRRIRFSNGSWWLIDPENGQGFRLDTRIKQCGWKVSRLCSDLGIGKRTFSRMVEEGLGITSKRWLREVRIVSACHLLREECKIEVVAHAIGFRHVSDFTREFKKLVGVAPSRYIQAEHSRSTGYRIPG